MEFELFIGNQDGYCVKILISKKLFKIACVLVFGELCLLLDPFEVISLRYQAGSVPPY